MDKKQLSERDICTKFITPAVKRAGWDEMLQVREEVGFTTVVMKRVSTNGASIIPAQANGLEIMTRYIIKG